MPAWWLSSSTSAEAHPAVYPLEAGLDVGSAEFQNTIEGVTGMPFVSGNHMAIYNNGDEFYPERCWTLLNRHFVGAECFHLRERTRPASGTTPEAPAQRARELWCESSGRRGQPAGRELGRENLKKDVSSSVRQATGGKRFENPHGAPRSGYAGYPDAVPVAVFGAKRRRSACNRAPAGPNRVAWIPLTPANAGTCTMAHRTLYTE